MWNLEKNKRHGNHKVQAQDFSIVSNLVFLGLNGLEADYGLAVSLWIAAV